MKPYLFHIRLYAPHHAIRLRLEKTRKDENGKAMSFAAIIRKMILEADLPLSSSKQCYGKN